MKYRVTVLVLSVCCFVLSGCGNNVSGRLEQTNTVDKVLNEQIQNAEDKNNGTENDTDKLTQMALDQLGWDDAGNGSTSDGGAQNDITTDVDEDTQPEQTIDNVALSSAGSVGNTTQTIPYMTADEIKSISDSTDVDIDIAAMEGDMVYATVLNILMDPQQFEGNTVRMRGQCVYSYNEDASNAYANVIIADALACCAQGLEFQRGKDGEFKCPEDYPAEGSEVVVTGELETYMEGNDMYFRIGNADVIEIADDV